MRRYINDNLYNGFDDDIKNGMKTMAVNGFVRSGNIFANDVTYDKVKIPSVDEVGLYVGDGYGGIKPDSDYVGLGSGAYPLFGQRSRYNSQAAITDPDGTWNSAYITSGVYYNYYLRSHTSYYDQFVMFVSVPGSVNGVTSSSIQNTCTFNHNANYFNDGCIAGLLAIIRF